MTEFVEVTGKSEEDAIKTALTQLGLERDTVRIEVVHRAKSGFMGFGAKPAKVKIHYERPELPKEPTLEMEPVSPPKVDSIPSPVEEPSPSPVEEPNPSPLEESNPSFLEEPHLSPVEEPQPMQESESATYEQLKSVTSQVDTSVPVAHIPTPTVENNQPPEEQPSQVMENNGDFIPTEEKLLEQNTSQWDNLMNEAKEESKPVPKKNSKKKGKEFSLQEKEEIGQATEKFLSGLLERLHIEAKINMDYRGEVVIVRLEGENVSVLIGRRGETLDAIQQLTTYVIQKDCKKRLKVWLDAENYREKREETLVKLAEKMAGQVVKNRRNVPMEAMNAYERHIIHETLTDFPKIYTYSTGSEPNRRIVIAFQGNNDTDGSYEKGKRNKGKQNKRSHYEK